MKGIRAFLAGLGVAVLAACGGSGGDGTGGATDEAVARVETESGDVGAVAGAPAVEATYQEGINEAWQEAVAGENPSTTCAALKGRAAVSEPGAADRALAACNLDVPVRYFLTYVERVEAGEKTCMELMSHLMTTLPAMTISTEGFRELARRAETADTSDAAAVAAGTALLAGEAAAGGGANDPRQAIKDRLREPVTAACPNEAAIILR